MSDKPVEQIRAEWNAIEAKRPGGGLPNVEAVLRIAAERGVYAQEASLIEMIRILHDTLKGYHVEMGTLLAAPALASAQGEQARGALREGLSILLVSAQSAEAARLDQMHNHLDTGHPAAQTDGQAAQIHRLYVQAITQLLAPAPAGAE